MHQFFKKDEKKIKRDSNCTLSPYQKKKPQSDADAAVGQVFRDDNTDIYN